MRQLKRYHKKGPDKTTRILLDAPKVQGIEGLTLLDIGGGFGAIQYDLLKNGLRHANSVEAATAYIDAAREEALRQGLDDRIRLYHGDFVDLASEIQSADIVTLDRVICCYHDMAEQVGSSLERSRKLYGLVYPRDT
jgi:magnesium-protoporphyrin O-methyltransferase